MHAGDNHASKLARLRTAALGGSPNEDPESDIPYWAYVAMLMRKYNWTEKQATEENSPAMLARLALLDNLEASRTDNQASGNPLDKFRGGGSAQNRIQSI